MRLHLNNSTLAKGSADHGRKRLSVNLVEAEELVQEGATAFVDKKVDMGYELASAVRAASSGQSYFSRSVCSSVCSAVQ